MNQGWIEVCTDSLESAIIANQAGADRLELCANLCIGGTTPSEVLFERIRQSVNCPIHVLIRPRFGDFHYTRQEQEIMVEEIRRFAAAGADGIVTGGLTVDGILDLEMMKQVKQAAGNKKLTLHRAFDMTRDPEEALEMAKKLEVDTILTSGQAQDCDQGAECLRILAEKAGEQITIMAGGGVHSSNMNSLHEKTGITWFHMSGKILVESPMKYRNQEVHMGLPGLSEYEGYRTDPDEIRSAKKIQRTWTSTLK